jgi:hypothetical protein
VEYFSSIGYSCPINKNPADFFMSLLSEDSYSETGQTEKSYEKFVESIAVKYLESPKCVKVECDPQMIELTDEYVHQRKYKAPWLVQFKILFGRSILNSRRLFFDQLLKFIGLFFNSLLLLSLYYKVPHSNKCRLQLKDMKHFRIEWE